jgi:putative flippase GtrA
MDLSKYHSVFKFLFTGGLAALTEYIVFLTLHHVTTMALVLANSLSFLCGLVISFTLNKHWVFGRKGNGGRQFGMYFVLACVNLLIGNGLIVLLVDHVSLPPFIGKLCVMMLIASWNFFIFQNFVFRARAKQE